MNNIHTFGDSHSSNIHSHWGYINIPGINIKCNHIGSRLMYTFGKLGFNLLNIRNYGVKENDTVIFCFGEIDCRNHVHKHITEDKTYKIIIDELVNNYFKSIKENIDQYENIKTCIYNVVPPTKGFDCGPDHPHPFLGTDEERKTYYIYMNEKLKEFCEKYNYFYFDIYKESCDNEGFLNKEYSDGLVHLKNPEHSTEVIKKYLINICNKKNSNLYFELGDDKIYTKKNVKNVTCNIHNSDIFFELYDDKLKENNIMYFYLFETHADLAFSHWFYESFIYLSYFNEYKKIYPQLKLLVKQNPKRSYKTQLIKMLNIKDDDIYFLNNEIRDDCKTNYMNIPKNNICICVKNICCNNVIIKNKDYMINQIELTRQLLFNNLKSNLDKNIEHLFFVKSKTEVYTSPDINYNNVLKFIKDKKYIEYDPINTKNFVDQISLLQSSKNIYLPWGGSFSVNGLLCNNSNIYIYGDVIEGQKRYDIYSIIIDLIKKNGNKIYFI